MEKDNVLSNTFVSVYKNTPFKISYSDVNNLLGKLPIKH